MSRIRILLVFAVALLSSMSASAGDDARLGQLRQECIAALHGRRYDDMAGRGDALAAAAAKVNNESMRSLGKAFSLRGKIGGGLVGDHDAEAAEIERLADMMRLKGDTISETSYFLNSSLCLFHIYDQTDYPLALLYGYRALRCAEMLGDKDLESDALIQLSALYFLKGDSRGWDFAVRCDNIAKSTSNYSGMYAAAVNMANYLFNKGDYKEAVKYLEKGQNVMVKGDLDSEKAYIDSFLGDALAQLGKLGEAEIRYREAIYGSPMSSKYDIGYAKMRYSEFLVARERMKEALELLGELESSIDSLERPNYYSHLLLQLADTYEAAGQYRAALRYYKRYVHVNTELINAEKEKEIGALETRYKVVEAQNRNIQQSLELSEKNRRLIVLSCMVAGLLVITVFLWRLNDRNKRYYRRIVDDTLQRLDAQEKMEERLREAAAPKDESRKGASGELGDRIYEELKRLMAEEHIYRQSDLSIEALARMMGTNRTYLSRIINERARVSYATFINEHRLNEIIRRLSDPGCTDALKDIGLAAGFATTANFYTLFKQRVGVSPAVFRKNAAR